MTAPDESRVGGVTQYLHSLRPHWSSHVRYVTVGARSDREGIFAAACRIFADTGRFCAALWREPFDLVHLNPSIAPKAFLRDGILLLVAKAFGKPVLVFAHGWDGDFETRLNSRGRWMFRWSYGRADAFVVLGSNFVGRLKRLGYRHLVSIHRAPLDDALLHDAQRYTRECATQMAFNILFLARIEKDKGIYEAIEAYRIVRERCPAARLIVAGRGSELDHVMAKVRADSTDGVSFLGHVQDEAKFAAFRAADAYLFPSHHEGLPLSLLEAMAYGLPVVTSAVGGVPDFFVNGVMGFMIDHPTPDQLAAALLRIIQDRPLRESIGSFNKHYARDNFSSARIAAGLEDIYRSVCDGAH